MDHVGRRHTRLPSNAPAANNSQIPAG
jgi:hypothetical protein